MSRKNYFANILIVFGLMTLLASLVDMFVIVIPLHLANSQWVFYTAQEIAERSIIPILGVIAILSGFIIKNNDTIRSLNMERSLSTFCFSFSIGLILTVLLYTLTINSVTNQVYQSLKQKNESTKKQVVISYIQANIGTGRITKAEIVNNKIPANKELQNYLKILDKNLAFDIKSTNIQLFKKNIKTILNLILFAFAYIFIGITGFKSTSLNLKKLRYAKHSKNN